MTTAGQVLAVAQAEIGYVEGRGNRTKYGAWYGMDGQAWCAMFTSWVLQHAGMPRNPTTHFAYTPYGYNAYRSAGRWHASPQPGDLVFFSFSQPSSSRPLGISHVGFVEAVQSGAILTIEGNTDVAGGRTGGRVMRKRRTARIAGYGRPAYAAQSPPLIEEDDMWTIVNERGTPRLWALGGTVKPAPDPNAVRQWQAAGLIRNKPDGDGNWPPVDRYAIDALR